MSHFYLLGQCPFFLQDAARLISTYEFEKWYLRCSVQAHKMTEHVLNCLYQCAWDVASWKCSVPWAYGQGWKRDLLQAHLTLEWSMCGQLYSQLCEIYLLCEYTAFPGMPKSKFVEKKKKKILHECLWRSTKKVAFDVIGYNILITLKCVCTFLFCSIWSVLKATRWATNLTLFKKVQPNP